MNDVLAELFIAFQEAGLDPAQEFNAMGGGIPGDFHTFAVVKYRKMSAEKSSGAAGESV